LPSFSASSPAKSNHPQEAASITGHHKARIPWIIDVKTILKIRILNNLRLTQVPETIGDTLKSKLTIVNPKWLENKRMGRWNGRTRYTLRYFRRFKGGGLSIPRGYIRQLVHLCRSHQQPFKLIDERRKLKPVEFAFNGRLRPYQALAVKTMLKKDFGTLCAPTGSGKTVMALWLIAQRRQPALVVVHTKDLAFQWVERIRKFLELAKTDVGFIGDGRFRITPQVTVALVQSLYKRAKEVSRHVGYILVDECHRCPSRTFTEAVTRFNTQYMTGLTATPFRRDNLTPLIFWHLGDMHHEIDKSTLVKTGAVLPAEAVIRETDFKPFFDAVNEYSRMLSELTADDDRNRMIAADVHKEVLEGVGVCLVLSDRKKHCENLCNLLKYRYGIDAELMTGDLSAAQRRQTLDRITGGQSPVLVATGQLIGEGFDCRELTTLFLATPIRFSGRVVQYLGRILRPAPGKNLARVYDYVDVHVPTLRKAFQSRLRIYHKSKE
jgi:superfamily II DNA or RNA helicase